MMRWFVSSRFARLTHVHWNDTVKPVCSRRLLLWLQSMTARQHQHNAIIVTVSIAAVAVRGVCVPPLLSDNRLLGRCCPPRCGAL
jgi:hypothetical protein